MCCICVLHQYNDFTNYDNNFKNEVDILRYAGGYTLKKVSK